MNYHTAVVVVLCSMITLAGWLAWLWRPARPPRPRKQQEQSGMRWWAEHTPLWRSEEKTTTEQPADQQPTERIAVPDDIVMEPMVDGPDNPLHPGRRSAG